MNNYFNQMMHGFIIIFTPIYLFYEMNYIFNIMFAESVNKIGFIDLCL